MATLLVLVSVIFFLVRITGDPAARMIPPQADAALASEIRSSLGLDAPLYVQYFKYLGGFVGGDLGRSFYYRIPVTELLAARLPASLTLAAAALFTAIGIGLPLGVYSAVKRGSMYDLSSRWLAILGGSFPSFVVGLILIRIFSVEIGILPIGGTGTWRHIILPAATLGWFVAAPFMRLTRSAMIETLSAEYVVFARLKGLSGTRVIWLHALKNALVPVVTYSGVVMAAVVGGAVVTEYVFAWPGLGTLLVGGIAQRDFPIVQGVVITLGAVVVLSNLAADLVHGYLDPKVRVA